ncbi:uncharacterized protein LOC117115710 isoform X2 [Anneissia japonica]|uniref:uncharacterized protein LOC117115710 isoform X2 n=1 Tax=Anneissia japonica TaxID=1529436 RepID=UPI0014257280|nr:uncharacterized protein LOC117115710 isoform X2 [Anneissia japonica]
MNESGSGDASTSKRQMVDQGSGDASTSKRQKVDQAISDEDFMELKSVVSEWFDQRGYINNLKVLYTDLLSPAVLHNASTTTINLLNCLTDHDEMNSTNLTLIYDTIKVSKQFRLVKKIKEQLPSCPIPANIKDIEISSFTPHRLKLMKLGSLLTEDDVPKIDQLYNDALKKYADSWCLIMDLEKRSVICEENMEKFITKLKKLELKKAVDALCKGNQKDPEHVISLDPEHQEQLRRGSESISKRTLDQGSELESTSKRKKLDQGISDDEFREILSSMSGWYDCHGYIAMLKVLCRDLVTEADKLYAATNVIELFELLRASEHLSPTDPTLLYDIINVTKPFGLEPEIIKLTVKTSVDTRTVIPSRFTANRQSLMKVVESLSDNNVKKISKLYGCEQKADKWELFVDLEHRGMICEENMDEFMRNVTTYLIIESNNDPLGLRRTVKDDQGELILTGNTPSGDAGTGDTEAGPSTSTGTTIGCHVVNSSITDSVFNICINNTIQSPATQDLIIRDSVNKRQKQLYQNVNQMTPTIWHEDHELDIAEVFTELILMQSQKEDKKSESKSTSKQKKGSPTSLKEVLGVIKSTDSCKVLITGKGGMGKTTLLRYIAYKWATDDVDNAFANKLLFLINIRDLKAGEMFVDIIMKEIDWQTIISKNKLPPNSVKDFLVTHADEIVILLDGYDELEKGAKNPIDLFKRTELGECTVLMSSRPDNIGKFFKWCDIHIKVMGFNPRNIKEYIHKYFDSIGKAEIGDSLIREFGLDNDNYYGDIRSSLNFKFKSKDSLPWYNYNDDDDYYDDYYSEDEDLSFSGTHKKAFELCSSPLLLLNICTIWENKECLPTDLSDLFKELFCSNLNQYQNRGDRETSISQFESIPEKYRHAMQILGEIIYEGLKKNKLPIDKCILLSKANDKHMVHLALELGFVYKESPVQPGDVREIYTTPHKLISESLAGFYLFEQIQKGSLKAEEYEVIRCNKYLQMTRVFTIGFLGDDACLLFKHWMIIRASNFYSIAQCLEYVKKDHEDHVIQELDKHMPIEMKACCEQLRQSVRSVLDYEDTSNVHLFTLMKKYKYLTDYDVKKVFPVINTSNEESLQNSCRNIVHNTVVLPKVYKTKHFFRYISKWEDKEINILSAEMKNLHLTYNLTSINLNFNCSSSFFIHFLKHAYNLSELHIKDWCTASEFSLVINELNKADVKLKLICLDIQGIDLASVSRTTLGHLSKVSPHLIHIDMSYCNLSGSIINEVIEECCRMNVVLKDNMLRLMGNDLSDIDSKSFAELIRVIGGPRDTFDNYLLRHNKPHNTLKWRDYSLTSDHLEKLVNSIGENETLNWDGIDMSRINLSLIRGRTLAQLLKVSPHLIHIDMSHCNLSFSIINEMMEECCRMNVVLKNNMLRLEGNDLSDIDSKSLAELIRVIRRPHHTFDNYLLRCIKPRNTLKWRDYSLTSDHLEKLVDSIGENETLNWTRIDMSKVNLSLIRGRTLAQLLKVSPHLIHIDMSHCNLSFSIINEMMEECCRMIVVLKDNMLRLEGNDLSDIDSKSLAELIRVIGRPHHILDDYLLGHNKPHNTLKWSDYSLTSDHLEKLVDSIGENETLNLDGIDISRINLSSVRGRTLVQLLKVSPHLINIDMSECNLSGSIINEMMEECCRMNVVLKDNMLRLEGNDLSDIDSKSLAELIRVIGETTFDNYLPRHNKPHNTLKWSDYSLTSDHLEKMVDSIGKNKTLSWTRIDMSRINLFSIRGRTLAQLLKVSPHLIHIDMRECNLSGSIINEMMEECCRMNVVLKDNMLELEGNDLSNIGSKSLAELIRVIDEPHHTLDDYLLEHNKPHNTLKWSDYSLTSDHLEKLVDSIGKNKTLSWTRVDMSRINLSSIRARTLAQLLKVSPHLIHIDMSRCNLSFSIINEMMEECYRMNVVLKNNMLRLEGNDLSDIDSKSLAELIRVIGEPRDTLDNYFPRHNKPHNTLKWSDYSLTSDHLEKLVDSIGENETLNWDGIDMSRINLSSIRGRTLAQLLKVSPHLIRIDMSECNLSGSSINEMMEECCRMNVVLKDNMLRLEDNDLSDIDSKSLAELIRVIGEPHILDNYLPRHNKPHNTLKWSDYSLTSDHLEKLVDSIGENETLSWTRIDMSRINLSSVRARILAQLLKVSPRLIHIDMSHCNLSFSIINEMMEECCRMNVVLKNNMLRLEGNDLSDIDSKSLAELIRVIGRPHRTVDDYLQGHNKPHNTLKWSDYSLTSDHLGKLVDSIGENETLNWDGIDISRINLSSVRGRTLAQLLKVSPHLIHIDMSECNLSFSIINEMMEECCRMNVVLKDNMLKLEGNDLSDIDSKSLAELIRVMGEPTFDNYLPRHNKPHNTLKWSDYSLTSDHLEKLVDSIGENETLNWDGIDMSRINLSSIRARTLAQLLKVSPHLIHIDMSHCNLSGSIINEMMEECCRMNVVLKDNMLKLEGNDLSDIDSKSLAELIRVIGEPTFDNYLPRHYKPHNTLKWSDYSLTSDHLEKLVDSIGKNKTLSWTRIDMSRINLSSVRGRTLAQLLKVSPHLIRIDMRECNLSGSSINEMMEECCRMNVVLKDNMLKLEDNDLSDIGSHSLAELIRVIDEPHHTLDDYLLEHNKPHNTLKWSDYSLTSDHLEKMVDSIGKNKTLSWTRIDMSRINLSSIRARTFAQLLKVSPRLIHIDMSHCNLSFSIINEMMEECCRMNVVLKNNMLRLEGNDLSDIDSKSLAELIRVIGGPHHSLDNYLPRHYKPHNSLKWSDYSFTSDHLEKLVDSIGENETLSWTRIDMSRINLSSVRSRILAHLLKVSPRLIHIDMSHCNLSFSIINEMMEECCRMNVVLKDNMLRLEGNDLSDIDSKSLAELIRVIGEPHDTLDNYLLRHNKPHNTLKWSNYSLTSDHLEKLVDSISENETLNWDGIDMSRINLSSIRGRTLAQLLKVSPHLIRIDISECNLSGSSINEMMEECCRMNVVLKDNMLRLEGNDLSDIDSKSLAELIRVIGGPHHSLDNYLPRHNKPHNSLKWSDYSFTSDHLEKLVDSIGENETLNWTRIDMSRINLSSIRGRTLAQLLKVSPHLIHIDMSHCNLSITIINEMMEECCRMNVVLKNNMLRLEGNDLSEY